MSSVDLTETKQGGLRTLFITMMVFPTVVVLVRVWSRALLPDPSLSKVSVPTTSKFWWDDWTIIIAAVLNIAVCAIGLRMLQLGLGLHVQVVSSGDVESFLKILWAVYFVFDTGTALSKSSALFFYARIFGVSNAKFKYALWVLHALNIIWLVIILFFVIFMCDPVESAWDIKGGGKCLNTGLIWQGSGISSLIIDVLILIMPLPMLWKLRMRTIQKMQVSAVFMCGYLVVVVSIGRLVTIIEAGNELDSDVTCTAFYFSIR
ncbi:hypothetical protein F4804DRAFT_328510 [Jackrogersella minutella]|nr:hypothetical protein F4804DRAFT_328510 [Jackrogersella minutella]